MKNSYKSPLTNITVVVTNRHILSGSGAGQSGLSGATQEEYTGGTVKWSRKDNRFWDDDEE